MSRILSILVLTSLMVVSSFPVAAVELFASENQKPDYPTVKGLQFMAQRILEQSNGRLVVKVVPDGKLGSEKEVIELLRTGKLAFARVSLGALAAVVPEASVLSMPFLFRNTKHEQKVLEGPIGADILAEINKNEFIGLAYYESGFRSFYTTKKPIRSLEDMKGLRIRVQESELSKHFVAALGAIPVPMDYGNVGRALKDGSIDGAENNWSSYVSAKHFETAKFYTLTNHIIAPDIVLISKRIWETLSPEDKKLVAAAAIESVPVTRQLTEAQEVADMKAAAAAGVQITEMYLPIDRQPFVLAMRPVYQKFLSTESLRKFANRISNTY